MLNLIFNLIYYLLFNLNIHRINISSKNNNLVERFN